MNYTILQNVLFERLFFHTKKFSSSMCWTETIVLYHSFFNITPLSSMLWHTRYEVNTKILSFNKTKTGWKPNQINNKKQRTIILAMSSYTFIQLACLYTKMCEKILPYTSYEQYSCFKDITEVLKTLRFVFPLFITLNKHPIKFLTPLKSF